MEENLFVSHLLKQENGGEFQSVFDFCPTVLKYSSLFLDINKKINILKHSFPILGLNFQNKPLFPLKIQSMYPRKCKMEIAKSPICSHILVPT